MEVVSWDCETHPIKLGMLAPKMVCSSFANNEQAWLENPYSARYYLENIMGNPDITIVGANLPYDLGVLCAEDVSFLSTIFDLYDQGRLRCVQVRQKLIDIYFGWREYRDLGKGDVRKCSVSLQALVDLYFNKHLEKEDTWRLRYHELDSVPLEQWPEDAKQYALDDAIWTLKVYQEQEASLDIFPDNKISDELPQQRAAWALHLMSMCGLRTDIKVVDRFINESKEALAKMEKQVEKAGIIRPNGTKDMEVIRQRVLESLTRLSVSIPRTPKDQVKTDEETLRLTDDPVLLALADSMGAAKDFNQWSETLELGTRVPICARYNVLVHSGRTSCSNPNLQNPPRDGLVRECFSARPGCAFIASDYDTAELRSLAQVLYDKFGENSMQQLLWEQYKNNGPDLHIATAASLLKIDIKEAWERFQAGDEQLVKYRQAAKPVNFGYPGGLGIDKFTRFAWKSYGIRFSLDEAKAAKNAWFNTYPEMRKYFEWINTLLDRTGSGRIQHFRSGRFRGNIDFCSAANSFFQGLTADVAKRALYLVSRECYTDKKSSLYGSRPVIFLHDEIIIETPLKKVHEAGLRLQELMIKGANEFLTDVPSTAGISAFKHWAKGVKPVYVDGKLVPSKSIKVINEKSKEVKKWVADI